MRTIEPSPKMRQHSVASTGLGQSTIGAVIRRHAEVQPDHAAVVVSGFAPLSYRELQRLIDDFRAALRLNGFGRSARIAIAIPNSPQAALAIVAAACSTVTIPLNPRQTLGEIGACLTALQPDAVLLIKGANSAARRVAGRMGIRIIETTQPKHGTLGLAIAGPPKSSDAASDEFEEPDADAPAFILQTSGTAAEPKLIPFSHRNMLAAAARVQSWFELTPKDRCLSVGPLFYSHGLKVTCFTPLLTGGTVAFPIDVSKPDYSEWFGDLRPTWYSAGPALHRLVVDQLKRRAAAQAGHSLRFVLSGGAPLPRDVLEDLQRTLGVPVVEHYGCSEAAQISSNLPTSRGSKPNTCGVPWPDTVVIAGDHDRPLAAGEEGEILVRGPTVISGYLNAPELNRVSFVNGWFKTGDLGSLDEDGFLTLHGRKDDLINRGGEKISPVEIDATLVRHPAVVEAAAFAVPHPRLGEDVAAAVVLRPGMTATPVELRGFLQDKLAPFKVPRRIFLSDQLPKGQTGKVLRRRLAESMAEKAAIEVEVAMLPFVVNTSADSLMVVQLTELWERLLKIAPLSPEDNFFEKGGDSLLAIEMLVELEQLTGRNIPSTILLDASTIRQLALKLSGRDPVRQQCLIQLNSSGSRAPLFYFHGDYNWRGYSAVALAKLLGSHQPLFIIAPHGMGDEPIPRSIEAMAVDRLQSVVNAQPEGPYRLCGNCLGGVVAFEVARLLVAAGKNVELVVMLDTPTINARRSVQVLFSTMRCARLITGPVVELAMAWTWIRCMELQKFWNISWARRWTAIKARARNLAAGSSGPVLNGPILADQLARPSIHRSRVDRFADDGDTKYAWAMSNYVPKPLAVRIIHFTVDFPVGAWRRLSSNVEIIKSSGTHNNLNFADIAKHLTAQLRDNK